VVGHHWMTIFNTLAGGMQRNPSNYWWPNVHWFWIRCLQSLPPGHVNRACNLCGGGESREWHPLYWAWCKEPAILLYESRTMGREEQLPVLCPLQSTLCFSLAGWCHLGWSKHLQWQYPASAILGVPKHVILKWAVIFLFEL
jgi:hypothetical protein